MVSDDTHKKTLELLERNNYFGLSKEQISIIKQENVPAVLDNKACLAVDTLQMQIITKPHGHGDVHKLLY